MKKIAGYSMKTTGANIKPDFGFTLLEIMVSISIIAIVLVSVYRLHAQTITMNYAARFYTIAPMLANLKIAELQTKTIDDLTDNSGDFGEDYSGYRWNVTINDIESETLGSTAENLKRIDVIVTFNNDEFTYDLRTYNFF